MGVSPLKPAAPGTPAKLHSSEGSTPGRAVSEKISLSQKSASKESIRPNTSPQNAASAKADGTASLNQALLSLGLPRDSLSRALLIFSRFFSLPIDRTKLAGLRREVLDAAAEHPDSPLNQDIKKLKAENRAFAAAAAFDKGVRLSAEALDAFSGFSEPDFPDGEDFFPEDAEKRAENEQNGMENSGGGHPGKGGDEDSRKKERKNDGDGLKKTFERFMGGKNGRQHTAQLLNRLPGKNGRHWIVWPFVMKEPECDGQSGGLNNEPGELKVLLRILLKEPLSAAGGTLILDAAGRVNRWRFILNKSGETLKANISVFPEPPGSIETLKKEAETLLAFLGPAEIRVSGANESGNPFPSLEDDFLTNIFEEEVLPSVNKEV